jgi:hypothetical protein
MPSSQRAELLSQWRKAVSNSLNWVDPNGKSDNDGSSNAPSCTDIYKTIKRKKWQKSS